MAYIAAIGERQRVIGFSAVGVTAHPAQDAEAVRAAWRALPADVGLVLLTPAAAEALGPERGGGEGRLVAVMPS
ncbi:V-type ATP synthase subunit F [Streptomyces sp. S.PB5]|uniref:V-type ATP synthase subunit F n=1 Tax=Streptomyces sp. S.PB5 TaxID=3020844 RepID=UPI0025AF2E1C|nr:V-type ATP synthase subunit F [Streptomyces sp. S.PB5]MDN3027949.1 V-type ATP synthase subunit F [Streptomyces sp. S.PB5]